MRGRFVQQLEQLHQTLIQMGVLCGQAIAAGTAALLERDISMARAAAARQREISRQGRELEGLCMELLLRQQPVARDLRAVSSALKMIADMERIGVQAADIGEIAEHIGPGSLPGLHLLEEMAQGAMQMVEESVESFVKGDMQLARNVVEYDDVVDSLFIQIKDELTAQIRQDAAQAGAALDLLMAAKYLERIGDHAVNLARWVAYSINGRG